MAEYGLGHGLLDYLRIPNSAGLKENFQLLVALKSVEKNAKQNLYYFFVVLTQKMSFFSYQQRP